MECLKRFDFGLAARIRRSGPEGLAQLLDERLRVPRPASAPPASSEVLQICARTGRPAAAVIDELLADGSSLTELQNDAVQDLCLQGEDVQLPGVATLSELLPAEAEGTVSSLDVLPGTDEEVFLLLRPQHLDHLVKTLQELAGTLGDDAPSTAPLAALERLRDACAARPGQLVAYCFED